MNSQTDQIRTYLEQGGALTPLDALNLFGCFRLGARIYDLKRAGMKIETEMIMRDGKRFARYSKAK
jgi:hypothetical protein